MTCTRCNAEIRDRWALKIHVPGVTGPVVWDLCRPCQIGLDTWFRVRRNEFPNTEEPADRANAELLHACRQALDACAAYPQLLDLLRSAIRGALKERKP